MEVATFGERREGAAELDVLGDGSVLARLEGRGDTPAEVLDWETDSCVTGGFATVEGVWDVVLDRTMSSRLASLFSNASNFSSLFLTISDLPTVDIL